MKDSINIQVDQTENLATVILSGEVDLYSSREARKIILELASRKVPIIIVDLSGVPYMDSSGLASMVEGLQKVESYKGKFILSGLQPMVNKVFELSRLNTVFTIYEDIDTALNELDEKNEPVGG
ncbi:STAS domain-containing protein [candidate division KSB1 bacterium]|nr:STAS domain-containing protein [candidate division KSB1 bacterium]